MKLGKSEGNKNNRENVVETFISYYEDIMDLRTKIISKERELIEKKRINSKDCYDQKNKLSYRSFEEFYKYKKNCEEYENKIKNETWKLLNRSSHKNEKFNEKKEKYNEKKEECNETKEEYNEKKEKCNEKYSYIKFKTERRGTVKQLKEYFQKIQEEKIQKGNSLLNLKNSTKSVTIINDTGNKNEIIKNKQDIRDINEKNKSVLENKEKGEIPMITYKVISTNEFSKNAINKEKEKIGKTKEEIKNEIKGFKKRINHINVKELELLYRLINEMKSSCESDEAYISKLIEELNNSNKRYMIEKILDLLKILNNKVSIDDTNKDFKMNNSVLEKNEQIVSKMNHNVELTQIDNTLKNIKPRNEIYQKSRKEENEDSILNIDQNSEIYDIKTSIVSFDTSKETKTSDIEDSENERSENSVYSENISSNTSKNISSSNSQKGYEKEIENNSIYNHKRENSNNNNVINDNNMDKDTSYSSKFDWFYSTMNDLYKQDTKDSEEYYNSNDEIRDDSSTDNENNDLFLWLKNRDVDNILNGKKKINDNGIME